MTPITERCQCANKATVIEDGEAYCEWCIPHFHEFTQKPHDFTANMLCRKCRLLAQDCCEVASECPAA